MNAKEYLPNAWESMGGTYYVAGNDPAASDDNPGTQEKPFKTISKAAAVMDMGDTALISEGTYREEVPILRNGHMYQPKSLLGFKAAPGQEVYLKGSDVFEAEWEAAGDNMYKARLPEYLFAKGAYNPYELSIVVDEPGRVRPVKGAHLPETLGQIYIDGTALVQETGLEAVSRSPRSFVVSADGKEIIVHCDDGKTPEGHFVELIVRQRCFRPRFEGPLFIQTIGMAVEHAAEPGAFSRCRPLSVRENPGAGILVKKTFNVPGTSERDCTLFHGDISYVSRDKPTLIASVVDDTKPCSPHRVLINEVTSEDAGQTWNITGNSVPCTERSPYSYFLDEEKSLLVRHYRKVLTGFDCDAVEGGDRYVVMLEISKDEGKSWSDPQQIDNKGVYLRIQKLSDGSLLWPYTENQPERATYHYCMKTLLGQWNKDLSSIVWKQGGMLEIDPRKSMGGLAEPQACQFPDGRIFVVLRQGNVLAAQDHPGFPSVKLFSVSADKGKSWSEPKPLTYEDGQYIYSPRSYQDTVCSSGNGKPYVIMNIADKPTHNCDPRATVQIAEVDTETLCVKRDSVAVIETMHEEHYMFVRFSNWRMIEDRYTKNLLLFMKLHMAELCFVRNGYDCNSYRYEIILPD